MKNFRMFFEDYWVIFISLAVTVNLSRLAVAYSRWDLFLPIGGLILALCFYQPIGKPHHLTKNEYAAGFASSNLAACLFVAGWTASSSYSFTLSLLSSIFADASLIFLSGKLLALKKMSPDYDTNLSQMAILACSVLFGAGVFCLSAYPFHFYQIYGLFVSIGFLALFASLYAISTISVAEQPRRGVMSLSGTLENEERERLEYLKRHAPDSAELAATKDSLDEGNQPSAAKRIISKARQRFVRPRIKKIGTVEIPVVSAWAIDKARERWDFWSKVGVIDIDQDWVGKPEDYTCIRAIECWPYPGIDRECVIGVNRSITDPAQLVSKLVLIRRYEFVIAGLVRYNNGSFHFTLPDGTLEELQPGRIIGAVEWTLPDPQS